MIDSEKSVKTSRKELIRNTIEGSVAPCKDSQVNIERPSSEKCPSTPVQYNCILCTACYVTKDELKVHFEGHKGSIPEGLKKAYRKTSIQEPEVLDIQAARQIAKPIKETSSNAEVMSKKTEEEKSKRNVEEKPSTLRESRVIDIRNIKQVAKEIEDKAALKHTSTSSQPPTKIFGEPKEPVAALESPHKEKKITPAKSDTYSCSLFKFKSNGHESLKDHISDTIQYKP